MEGRNYNFGYGDSPESTASPVILGQSPASVIVLTAHFSGYEMCFS